jgi:hypothetical protein
MTRRTKRLLQGLAAALLVGAGLLAALEWQRRRQVASAGRGMLEGSGKRVSATALRRQYSDPQEWDRLCAAVREHSDAIRARSLRLQHLRKGRLIELDRQGQAVAIVESLERVYFEGEKERKTALEVRQVLGRPIDAGKLQGGPDQKSLPPFSKEAPEGLYRYELEGIEEVAGRPVLRVRFEPVEPAEGTYQGSAWVDPDSAEPVRMHGSALKLPLLLDRLEMLIDYDPAENGHNQVRRATIDVAGGFAFFSRHYRLEAELSDYRPREP